MRLNPVCRVDRLNNQSFSLGSTACGTFRAFCPLKHDNVPFWMAALLKKPRRALLRPETPSNQVPVSA
jgi:hypothetical protein